MASLIRRLSRKWRLPNLPKPIDTYCEDDFGVTSVFKHGYPTDPSCFTFDPATRLLAIGTRGGFVMLYGRPGVEQTFVHDPPTAVTQIIFIPNTTNIITVCGQGCSVSLWTLVNDTGSVSPKLVKSSKVQTSNKEKITCAYLPHYSDWLLVGTSKGNVYPINVKTCARSKYVIYWSNANKLPQKNAPSPPTAGEHPGEVVSIIEPPAVPSRLLIAYSKGLLLIWNLKTRQTEKIFSTQSPICSVYWHESPDKNGKTHKTFTVSHTNGSFSNWVYEKNQKKISPGVDSTPFDGLGECDPIHKVAKSYRKGEKKPVVVFCGGLPHMYYMDKQTITVVLTGDDGERFHTLECPSKVIDFQIVETKPEKRNETFAQALLILTEQELIAVDLLDNRLPEFRLPYLSPINNTVVTCMKYMPHCPNTFMELLNQHNEKHQPDIFSNNDWPVVGGRLDIDGEPRVTDLVVTGHSDGIINIWAVSASIMKLVYTLETENILNPNKTNLEDAFNDDDDDDRIPMKRVGKFNPYGEEDDTLAICKLDLCPFGRILCMANRRGEVYKFVFNSAKRNIETPICTVDLSPPNEPEKPEERETRPGVISFPAGLQPELCIRAFPPSEILTMALNPSAGLLAFGNKYGLAIFDIQTHTVIDNRCTLNKSDPMYNQPYSNINRGEKLRRTFSMRASRSSKRGNNSVRRTQSEKNNRLTQSMRQVKSPPVPAASKNRSSFGATNTNSTRKSRLGASRRGLQGLASPPPGSGGTKEPETEEDRQRYQKSRVISLSFAETFPPDPNVKQPVKTLWAGMGSGKMQCFKLEVPEGRNRHIGVTMTPVGSMTIHHTDPILFMGFIDKDGKMLPEHNQIILESGRQAPHYLIVVSTVQVKVIELPTSVTVRKDRLVEGRDVLFKKAYIMNLRNSAALVCLKTTGFLNCYSLPHMELIAKNAKCLDSTDEMGKRSLTISRNGYAAYMYTGSEIQWITVAESFLPPDSWSIPVCDPVFRKKVRFDRSKIFEKGKATEPGDEQAEEVKEELGFTENRIDFPTKLNSISPDTSKSVPGSPELFSPPGSMSEGSDNGSRGSRRRSSIIDTLHDITDIFRSGSKTSIAEAAAPTEEVTEGGDGEQGNNNNNTNNNSSPQKEPSTGNAIARTNMALAERGDTLTSVEKNSSTLVEHTATMRNSMQKLKEKRAAQAGKLL